jgi:hypothetical protein
VLTVNEVLLDKSIEHQIGVLRFSTATIRKVLALLGRTDPDIVRLIQERVGDVETATLGRLEGLLAAIRDLNRRAYEAVSKALEGDLIELAHYEAEFQAKVLTDAMPIAWELRRPVRRHWQRRSMPDPFKARFCANGLRVWKRAGLVDSVTRSAWAWSRVKRLIRSSAASGARRR